MKTCLRRVACQYRPGLRLSSSTLLQYIQDDFVRERQKDRSVTSDDLVLRMTLARSGPSSYAKATTDAS
jgi:hypothetical protein